MSVKGFKSLINQYAPMTEKVFAALSPELKTVVRYGVGVDNVDLAAASRYGVCVCNVPDYGMYEVADQAVALFFGTGSQSSVLQQPCEERCVGIIRKQFRSTGCPRRR